MGCFLSVDAGRLKFDVVKSKEVGALPVLKQRCVLGYTAMGALIGGCGL